MGVLSDLGDKIGVDSKTVLATAGLGGSAGLANLPAAGAASGSFSSPDAPESPDPKELIKLQSRLNRVDQDTPFGSISYSGPNNTQAEITLDPQTQRMVDALQSQAANRAENLPSDQFDPNIPSVGGESGGSLGPMDQSTQAQQAVFEQARNLLEPQFERQEEDLRQTLSNQGLPAGGEAFGNQFDQFQRNRNRAYEDAAFRAVQQGNQRQNQLFEQGLASLGAQQQVRNQNLNELQALISGQQVQGGSPQRYFAPSGVDVMGPQQLDFQSQQSAFRQQNQNQRALLGALGNLGGAAIMGG